MNCKSTFYGVSNIKTVPNCDACPGHDDIARRNQEVADGKVGIDQTPTISYQSNSIEVQMKKAKKAPKKSAPKKIAKKAVSKKAVAKKKAKKSAPKKAAKKARKPRLTVINVKLSNATLHLLEARAKKFTDGNLSLLLRYAGLRYRPAKGESIPFKIVL